MKISNLLATLLAGYLLTGCSAQIDDLTAYTAKVKENTQVRIEPYTEFTSQPAFAYAGASLRSPFARSTNRPEPLVAKRQTNCLQPDYSREKEALEQYGLDALNLTGSFKSNGTHYVLFKTTDGNLLKARRGSRIGLFFGTIKEIGHQTVTIEQLLPDGAGCWQRESSTLSLNATAGDNNNV